jgi:hypothetical protein
VNDPFRHNFATVCAGYLVGHGILRFLAAFLVGVNDKPRAELLERWFPAWNALALFIAAWGVYHLILRARFPALRTSSNQPSAANSVASPTATPTAESTPSRNGPKVVAGWKQKIKAAQNRKDVSQIIEIRKSLDLPAERGESLDRLLGRWFTKHFQRMMLTGRAAESAPDVELVAEYFAGSEEFAYFKEILPVVRQCAEIKKSVAEDDDPETASA